jgi:hypothetical protein
MRDELKGRWNTLGGKVLGFKAKISDKAATVFADFKTLWGSKTRELSFTGKIATTFSDLVNRFNGKNIDFKANLTSWRKSFKSSDVDMNTKFVSWWTKYKNGYSVDMNTKFISWWTKYKNGYSVDMNTKFISWWSKFKNGYDIDMNTKFVSWWSKFKSYDIPMNTKFVSWWTSFKDYSIGMTAKFTSWWTSFKSYVVDMTAHFTSWFKAAGGVYSGGRWQPVTAAAGGGSFSMGQMFIAREAGPELVGTIGGNTAVMNNDQIVSSVAAGVAQAKASVMSAFVSQMNSGGDVAVYIDGDELTTAVVRGMRRSDKRNNPKVVFGG